VRRWLAEAGYAVQAGGAESRGGRDAPRLVIANVSSPQDAAAFIESLQAVYAAPILLLSARFRSGLGGSAKAGLYRVDTIGIGPSTLHDVIIYSGLPEDLFREEGVDGLIGFDMLGGAIVDHDVRRTAG